SEVPERRLRGEEEAVRRLDERVLARVTRDPERAAAQGPARRRAERGRVRDRAPLEERRLGEDVAREEEPVRRIAGESDREGAPREPAASREIHHHRPLPSRATTARDGSPGQSRPTGKRSSSGRASAPPWRIPRRSSAACIASGDSCPFHLPTAG